VQTGNRVWKDLIKSIPLDDFDPVLSRLGRNFGTTTAASEDSEIYDITTYEEEREMKLLAIQANHFSGILMGGNYEIDYTFSPRIGLVYTYDISSVLINIDVEYSSNNFFNVLNDELADDFLIIRSGSIGMGVIFPFYKRKNSPYANAGVEFGAANFHRDTPYYNETAGGLSLYGGAGYLMARTSTANIRFEIGFSVPTYKINNDLLYELKFGIITSFAAKRR
jgi:hypothetical protein